MFLRNIIAECRAAAFMRFFERADLPGSAVPVQWWGGRYSTTTLCNSTNTEWPRQSGQIRPKHLALQSQEVADQRASGHFQNNGTVGK